MKRLLVAIAVIVPMALGIYARMHTLKVWKKTPERFYLEGRPLFTSYDAFLFARYGRDFFEGRYHSGKRDPFRFVPDNFLTENVTYPTPVPMSSFTAGLLAKLFKTHIENVDQYFTPLLSVLLAIPLVLLLARIGYPTAGLCGALAGVLSYIYAIRTSVLRFDTDSLNLFFPIAMALFLHMALDEEEKKKRYLLIAAAGITGQLYYWWYRKSGIILVFLILFAGYRFLTEKFIHKRSIDYKELLWALIIFNPYIVFSGIFGLFGMIHSYIINFFKPAVESGFPNVQKSISELRHFNIKTVAEVSIGSYYLFAIGLAGTAALYYRSFKKVFLTLPAFLIGLMTLKGANRFAMYLAPFIGAGFGYLVDRSILYFESRKERELNLPRLVAFLAAGAIIVAANRATFSMVAYPRITPRLAKNFIKLRELTPEDAWIWTWWDYGYAIQYLGRRATFHDGGSQTTPKTYFVATTFSTPDQKLANTVIKAIANIGLTRIEEWIKEGIPGERIRDMVFSGNFSAPLKHPVYWAFTEDLVGKFAWINYFGTWNFKEKKGAKLPILPLSCRMKKKNILVCNVGILNLNTGILVNQNGQGIPIREIAIRDDDSKRLIRHNYHPKGLFIAARKKRNTLYMYVTYEQPFRSSFVQMYILKNYSPKYFRLIYDDFPSMVLYQTL